MSRRGTEKQRKLYGFLKTRRRRPFTIAELAAATGYANTKSLKTNLGVHWSEVVERTDQRWRSTRRFDGMTLEEFLGAISQSRGRCQHGWVLRDKRAKEMVQVARLQAQLAIELLNRPGLETRLEAFLVLFVNAWELLLKAEIVDTSGWGSIFRPTRRRQTTKSLRECAESTFGGKANAKYVQLDDLASLRDEATHLLVTNKGPELLHLFAGSLRDFAARYRQLTGQRCFHSDETAGFLVLAGLPGVEYATAAAATSEDKSELSNRIRDNFAKYGEDYAIPLRVKLVAESEASPGALSVSGDQVVSAMSSDELKRTFSLRQHEVCDQISQALSRNGIDVAIRPHELQTIVRVQRWRTTKDNPYLFCFAQSARYSVDAVKEIVRRITENHAYIEACKKKDKRAQERARKKRQKQR